MPTTMTKTVKPAGGGDYVSLNAAFAANSGDLTVLDQILRFEVSGGGNALTAQLVIGPGPGPGQFTTDATRYLEIAAASGHAHRGMWDTSKAYGEVLTDRALTVSGVNLLVTAMQLRGRKSGVSSDPVLVQDTGGPVIFDRCIIIFGPAAAAINRKAAIQFSSTSGHIIRSCLIISYGTSSNSDTCAVLGIDGSAFVYGSTLLALHAGVDTVGIRTVTSGTIVEDGNIILASKAYKSSGGTVTKGAHTATQDATATTLALRGLAFDGTNFKDITEGVEDLHIQDGSILREASVALDGMTRDIDGSIRTVPPSIGMDDIILPVAPGHNPPTGPKPRFMPMPAHIQRQLDQMRQREQDPRIKKHLNEMKYWDRLRGRQ